MTQTGRRMVLNSRERIISTDHNRLQSFADAALAETLRFAFDAVASGATAGGVVDVATAPTAPLRGVILSGLLVRPSGTVDLSIDPGVVLLRDADPAPSSDDSQLKRVVDPGLPNGTLSLTPGSGTVRVDIVECARTDLVLESDNRDIFDTSTGLFLPTAVPKVSEGRLTYRIRTGTPGGGFAGVGTVQGWMPLAVMVVGASATDWSGVTLYDVRALRVDVTRPHTVQEVVPPIHRSRLHYAAGADTLSGVYSTEVLGRRVGGQFDALSMTSQREAGFSGVGGSPFFVYLLTPFGLPRWCRYNSGTLLPGSVCGVPVISMTAPHPKTLAPTTPIALPTASGLGSASGIGVAVLAGRCRSGGALTDTAVNDGWTRIGAQPNGYQAAVVSGAGTGTIRYRATAGTHFPDGASLLSIAVNALLTGLTNNALINVFVTVRPLNAGGTAVMAQTFFRPVLTNGSGAAWINVACDIPLLGDNWVAGANGASQDFEVTYSGAGTPADEELRVMSFRFGS